jgi:hypothetical protein
MPRRWEQESIMGIRFFCPQGHRLNVKSFLAGKRGVCPDCGASVDIPMESDARALSSKKKAKAGGEAEDNGNGKATAVLDRPEEERPELDISVPPPQLPAHNDFALPADIALPPAAGSDVAAPKFAAESVQPAPVAAPSNGVALPPAAIPRGAAIAALATPSLPPTVADPIAEAPMAIWYVRPPAGGQYGPARGDVMRKWVGEGRVTSDSLVWREGWPDWRPANKVFPDLGSKSASSSEIGPIVAETTRRPIRPIRKTSSSQGVAIVITLGVVCLGLFVALLYVLMSNTGTVAPTP